jgi:hypothetical protein
MSLITYNNYATSYRIKKTVFKTRSPVTYKLKPTFLVCFLNCSIELVICIPHSLVKTATCPERRTLAIAVLIF